MKTVTTCFMFESSSTDKLYDTLLYEDGTTSCPCPGWTRRVQPDGSRSCKHTRLVEAGFGDREAVKRVDYTTRKQPTAPQAPAARTRHTRSQTPDEAVTRKFDFSL